MGNKSIFKRTLIITPHFDDETIGCGGLITKMSEHSSHEIYIVEVTEHADMFKKVSGGHVTDSDRLGEFLAAMDHLKVNNNIHYMRLTGYEDGKLDLISIKNLITDLDKMIDTVQPSAVLFPYSSHHQDHRIVYQASIAALRPMLGREFIKLKAMYEYPYINNWSSNVNPNSKLYIKLTQDQMIRKREALFSYSTQLYTDTTDILSVESITLLAESRGREIGTHYAEAFYPMSIIY